MTQPQVHRTPKPRPAYAMGAQRGSAWARHFRPVPAPGQTLLGPKAPLLGRPCPLHHGKASRGLAAFGQPRGRRGAGLGSDPPRRGAHSLTLLLEGRGVQLQVIEAEAGPGRAPHAPELGPADPAPKPHRAVVVLGDDGPAAAACRGGGRSGGRAAVPPRPSPLASPGTQAPPAGFPRAYLLASFYPCGRFCDPARPHGGSGRWPGGGGAGTHSATPSPGRPGSHSPMVRLGMLARMRSVAVL